MPLYSVRRHFLFDRAGALYIPDQQETGRPGWAGRRIGEFGMLKWFCAAALAMSVVSPALAQKPADRPLKKIKELDQTPIKEGLTALKLGGECTVNYIVATTGKAKNITADCTVPEMAPYAVRAVESGEWEAEIVGGDLFDSYPQRQIFRFGTTVVADSRGEKGPTLVTGIAQRDIDKAIDVVKQEGACDVKFTVGADGVPKDIVPSCTPSMFDSHIIEAVKKMKFNPGLKGGQPTDWPGMNAPMKLTDKDL